ncbi:xenotropic and polytropic retrovirus receptor 1 [Echria macrotheca]|uniref:Xenotropic and polytropic retrovirus receptor 1 n=1 Tax=Echria macrotheca TaxID=438768 RepID=A0AAJ0F753_9PEZI|nr:xenotropic and polytropic retrovirus receptor 1 [Echria macrotheca]
MKYGEQFAKESAPQWSLHNIDYNSLKHHIKVHTTKDQATAIAIPGYQDSALRVFEDELYRELCRQHDRVDMFVASKADEIARRLQHLSGQIRRLLIHCAVRRNQISPKRQRRFAKYENELLQCGTDIQSLQRFVGAQVVAFRKILKKYRKWTGSSTLGSRFRDTVLSHPKSFTKRDFAPLATEQENLLAMLRENVSIDYGASSPFTTSSAPSIRRNEQVSPSETLVGPTPQTTAYWNEYDNGSEAGEEHNGDGAYAIYINPDEDMNFPGVSALTAIFTSPIKKVNRWMRGKQQGEHEQLISGQSSHYGTTDASYFAHPPGALLSDTEAENESPPASGRRGSGYASSSEFPAGYKAYYAALPSLEEQQLMHYKERMLFWGTWACFGVSFLLMGIAAILIETGRHKMRLEVDAGVTIGIMTSLGAACGGLGMTLARQERMRWATVLSVWALFATTCVLNGILLVLVVRNTPLPT